MKLDFKKFKKVSADENMTVLQHDKGHKIHIAHKSLEPKMRKQLEKMEMHYADGGFVGGTALDDEFSNEPSPMASVMPSAEEQLIQKAQMPKQEPLPQPVAPMMEQEQDMLVKKALGQAPVLPSSAIEGINPEQQVQPEATQQMQPQQPKPEDIAGYGTYESHLLGGVAQQEEGIKKEAEARQLQAIEEQKALQQSQNTAKELQSSYQKNFDELEQDRKNFEDDLVKQKVDPNRFFNNMSTAQRISTGIGMILGGIGAGLTGGENPVMKMMHQQIENDIEAQKSQIGKTQNLLTANMHHFGNLKDAVDMTKAQNLDMLSMKMKQALSKSNNPQANAVMQQEIGKLEQQSGAIRQKIAMKRVASEFMNNANKDISKIPTFLNVLESSGDPELHGLAKEARGRYVPGVGMASVDVPAPVREKIIAGKNLQELISKVRQYAQENKGTLDPNKRAIGAQMTNILMDAYRTAKAQGVFKEAEKDFDATIIPQSPTSLFDAIARGNDKRYENLEMIFHKEHNNLLKGYGLKRNTGTLNVMPPKI